MPFNVEGQTSASTQLLVDRSLIHRVLGDRLEYGLGMFNGDGLNNLNQDNKYLYSFRLSYHALGIQKAAFSSMLHADQKKLSFAIGGFFKDNTDQDTGNDQEIYSATTDVLYHDPRIHVMAGLFYRHTDGAGVDSDDLGWVAQVGYMLLPKKLELAARVVQTSLEQQSDMHEYGAGFNVYFQKSKKLKLQTDYTLQQNVNALSATIDQINHQFRTQLQFKL